MGGLSGIRVALHHKEGNQLEVVESLDGVDQCGGSSGSKKAVDVALFLYINHGADGFAE